MLKPSIRVGSMILAATLAFSSSQTIALAAVSQNETIKTMILYQKNIL